MTREALTLACGKQLYFEMAAALARSFRVHHPEGEIAFTIATDDPKKIPADVAEWCQVHLIEDLSVIGFELKLNLDRYAKADATLFIDADCLVTRNLSPFFDELEGTPVTAFGKNEPAGEWFGDLAARAEAIGTDYIPVLVGALYYFERNETAQEVFDTARAHADRYDELGIVRLRGKKNEEPLISIGMAKNGLRVREDDARFKADIMGFHGPFSIDVFDGKVAFCEPKKDVLLAPSCQSPAEPAVAHFNDAYTAMWQYREQCDALHRHFSQGQSISSAKRGARLATGLPGQTKESLRNTFRPLFHRLFGTRAVKKNERL